MILPSHFAHKRVAVLGLGRSGKTTAHALSTANAVPLCWDDNTDVRHKAQQEGLPLTDLNAITWSSIDALILSPGIPHTYPAPHPVVTKAASKGLLPVCDIDCFFKNMPPFSPVVGVTGTNGKSTTSALIAHLLKTTFSSVAVGGNIGIPVLDLPVLERGFYVLELSSYQLELTPSLDLDVAIFLNLFPDHLDRHGGLNGYITAKKRIFQNVSKPLKAIIGVDDPLSATLFQDLQRQSDAVIIPISTSENLRKGVCVREGILEDYMDNPGKCASFTIDLRSIPTLRGVHNHQNAAASYAALKLLGMAPDAIAEGFFTFPGLAHRQEWVGTFQGVTYVNDSKATNGEATRTALQAYTGASLYCILGGRSKEGGLNALKPYLSSIAHAFLIGEASQEFGLFCELFQVPFTHSTTLVQALNLATQRALEDQKPHPVVLLSPACASFDQFQHFEERGNLFRQWVLEKFHHAALV